MCHDLSLSPPSFIDYIPLFLAVTNLKPGPVMQFLLALLAVLSVTVAFALPENEKSQGLNPHHDGAKSWTSSLRNLFHVDTRPIADDHESQPEQPFKFPSRISRRRHRARFHP